MRVIKQVGQAHVDVGTAEDSLAGIAVLPGFIFGYVDEKEIRCVSFHQDPTPGTALQRGQQSVELVFGPVPETDFKKLAGNLKPIADAIFGAGKNERGPATSPASLSLP